MSSKFVLFGPPGTGKTRFGQEVVAETLNGGQNLADVAFVAFNKTAARTAAERCGIESETAGNLWFRTLHSTGFKLLRAHRGDADEKSPPVMTGRLKREFGKQYGIQITHEERPAEASMEDLYWDVLRSTKAPQREGDKYLNAYGLSRLACRTKADLEEARKTQHPQTFNALGEAIPASAYRNFVEVYEGFKRSKGAVDFIDMISYVVEHALSPPRKWACAIVDECQDLAPLMHSMMERLFFDAEKLFLLGDDSQAIYSFMMSSAADFLKYRRFPGFKTIILRQTYRFGARMVDFARAIEDRIKDRQQKDVIPLAGRDNNILVSYEFDPMDLMAALGPDLDGAILHRHVAGCREIGKRLMQAGIPYWNERGPNPLARSSEIQAYLAWKALADGRTIEAQGLLHLVGAVPSKMRTMDGSVSLVRHGMKARIEEIAGKGLNRNFGLSDLSDIFTDVFLSSVRQKDSRFLDGVDDKTYYEMLLRNGYDLLNGTPRVVVTTDHGGKGREWDFVMLFSETFPCALESEDEHRVHYVAATRAKRDLWIVREPIVGNWTREYPYPI